MKIYFLILNLIAPLPFYVVAQPAPAVIYPSGGTPAQVHGQRAEVHERNAAKLKAIVKAGKVLMETGDSTKISETYKKALTARANRLLRAARAQRDSAK